MPDHQYSDEDDDEVMMDAHHDDDDDEDMEITAAPTLYERPSYFRQTRKKGKILKIVQERYLRDDLGFGCCFWDPFATKRRKGAEHVVGKPQTLQELQQVLELLQVSSKSTTTPTTRDECEAQIVVCDTNVLLHNFDVLQQACLAATSTTATGSADSPNTNSNNLSLCLVLPQTALEECRAQHTTLYDQAVELLRSVGKKNTSKHSMDDDDNEPQTGAYLGIFFPDQHHVETQVKSTEEHPTSSSSSINDVNDARLRQVAHFFGKHLKQQNMPQGKIRVIFLTDDQASRRLAKQEQQHDKGNGKPSVLYEALSVQDWVRQLEAAHPGLSLMDYVAHYNVAKATTAGSSSGSIGSGKQPLYFPLHLPQTEVSRGVQAGHFHRGVFRSVDTYREARQDQMGVVTIRQGDERVAVTIPGWTCRNRAMDGDVVAVAMLPVDQWIPLLAPSSTTTTTTMSGDKKKKQPEKTGISSETAEPTIGELSNVPESMTMDDSNNAASPPLRPTGRVVGILRRNTDLYSGSLWERHANESEENNTNIAFCNHNDIDNENDNATTKSSSTTTTTTTVGQLLASCEREHTDGSTTCVFMPVDPKIPPLLIRTTQRDRWVGQRLVVAMDSWPAESPFPLGHYTKTLGKIGDKAVETQVLLLQHNIPHEAFPAAVLACLPPADYNLHADYEATKEADRRVDLRHLPILSIDPPGCTDIDDALHCFPMDNGNYQVGVHIADVTHYVKAGTAIDLEAANRATSTYLVDRRLDMLPSLLSTDLCSLKGNVDRFAFSVLWEITPDAQIVNVEFQKTLIHSIAALTYQEAQTMIDLPDTPANRKDKQVSAVKGLARLARVLSKRRIDAGALTLASPEVKFVFDSESLNPTDVKQYAMLEANDLVMEFMLLANVTVGKRILRQYPGLSVLRRHPAPNRGRFDDLISKAKSRGFDLVIDDSKMLADSLDAAVIPSDPYFNKLLRICATRCLSPAQYFCSGEFRPKEWHHYGLAAPVYTHFTSPIRRYADVCVHRLLAAAIGVAPLPAHLSSKSYLHDLCANMNRRSRGAQNAGRSSVQLHTLIFFAGDDDTKSAAKGGGDGAKEEDAYVLDVEMSPDLDPSIRVIVPRYGIEGQVKLPVSAGDSRLSRSPEVHRISFHEGDGTTSSIQVFDKVKIRIWVKVSPDHQRELILDLLEPSWVDTKKDSTAGKASAASQQKVKMESPGKSSSASQQKVESKEKEDAAVLVPDATPPAKKKRKTRRK